MRRRAFLHELLLTGSGFVAAASAGCGTILHRERIHEPHSRDIDWKIAALNGLGLALFFVPGVAAFVVDFYTGAIYLPPKGTHGYPVAERSDAVSSDEDPQPPLTRAVTAPLDEWERKLIPPNELDREWIESVVDGRLGSSMSLCDSKVRISRFDDWNQLEQQVQLHLADDQHGVSYEAFFATIANT